MKKLFLFLLVSLIGFQAQAQKSEKDSFLKQIYNDFLKYGTVYGAGEISNSIEIKLGETSGFGDPITVKNNFVRSILLENNIIID